MSSSAAYGPHVVMPRLSIPALLTTCPQWIQTFIVILPSPVKVRHDDVPVLVTVAAVHETNGYGIEVR